MSPLTISETLVAVITVVTCLSATFWQRRLSSEEETYEYVLQEYLCFPDSAFALLHTLLAVSRDSIVGIVTSYGLEDPGFEFRQVKPRLDRLRDPTSLLFSGYRGSLPGVKWPGCEVDYTHLRPVPRLRMNGTVCSLYMAAWRLQEQLYVYFPLDFISCRFEVSKCSSIMGYYALYIHI